MATTTLTLGPVVIDPHATPLPGEEVVGDPPQWSDGSDATYLYGINGLEGGGSVRGSAPVTVPIDGALESARFFIRGKADPGFGTPPAEAFVFLSADYSDGLLGFVESDRLQLPHDGAIHEGWFDGTIYNNPDGFLAQPDLRAYVSIHPLSAQAWVYEVIVEVTYTAAPTAPTEPATRMFPRDDALGLSSAPRLVPPPKARRVVGGYL